MSHRQALFPPETMFLPPSKAYLWANVLFQYMPFACASQIYKYRCRLAPQPGADTT